LVSLAGVGQGSCSAGAIGAASALAWATPVRLVLDEVINICKASLLSRRHPRRAATAPARRPFAYRPWPPRQRVAPYNADYGPVIARLRARWRHRSARSWSGVGFAVAGRITSVSYGMPMSWIGPKDSSVRRILLHDVSPAKRDFDCIGSINHDLGQDQGLAGCFL